MTYDSTGDTLKHSLRVGALMNALIHELVDRSVRHDLSKTEEPELAVFNEFTPKLKDLTYGSEEYKACLAAMRPALEHHYAVNAHHPEHHQHGIDDMTLVDLAEMLADWKAATERHTDGDLTKSLEIQRERFGISDQLLRVLANTAVHFGWLESAPPATEVVQPSVVDDMYQRTYLEVERILDGVLGVEDADGAGMGLSADVRLLAQRYLDLKAAVLAPDGGTDWPRRVAEIEAAPLRCDHGVPVDEDCRVCIQGVRRQIAAAQEAAR